MSSDGDAPPVSKVSRSAWVRVPVKLLGVWAAMTAGALAVWAASAFTQPEPTRTFTFNFIESSAPFIAQLSIGGAILTTAGLEIARLASARSGHSAE